MLHCTQYGCWAKYSTTASWCDLVEISKVWYSAGELVSGLATTVVQDAARKKEEEKWEKGGGRWK